MGFYKKLSEIEQPWRTLSKVSLDLLPIYHKVGQAKP